MRLRDVRDRGHGADVERLGVGAVHRVAGAQEAPVEVLGIPAHGDTLRHAARMGERGPGIDGQRSWPIDAADTEPSRREWQTVADGTNMATGTATQGDIGRVIAGWARAMRAVADPGATSEVSRQDPNSRHPV